VNMDYIQLTQDGVQSKPVVNTGTYIVVKIKIKTSLIHTTLHCVVLRNLM
jgi:hypothetical protein